MPHNTVKPLHPVNIRAHEILEYNHWNALMRSRFQVLRLPKEFHWLCKMHIIMQS